MSSSSTLRVTPFCRAYRFELLLTMVELECFQKYDLMVSACSKFDCQGTHTRRLHSQFDRYPR
ncbi:hypothetical protein T08_234 [Trichinella sp. T8]|nr:hypothetical protein T08_234 [Trichinella sp. T8]